MARQCTHILNKLSHCVLLAFILIGLPTAALAEIIPLQLTLNEDSTVSLIMHDNETPLQLNQTFNHNTAVPFHLKGTVDGQANQRIALTVYEWPSDVVGSFTMNGQWYQIESGTSNKRHLQALATDSDLVAITPDVNLIGDKATGSIDKVLRHQSLVKKSINEQASQQLIINNNNRTTLLPTTRAIRVGIIVDSLFNEHHSGRGIARATTVMNGVDAILRNKLGLAVEVVHIVDYTDPTSDPFRGLESSIDTTLMPALQAERVRNIELRDNLSLVHLFTGHLDQNARSLIGLGWLDSICNSAGFDVGLSSPFLFDTLLATHEIMHNLGAPHDNSADCATYPNQLETHLMWPNISAGTTSELSSCSIGTARAALAADCTVDAIDMSIEIALSTQANPASYELTIGVNNTDSWRTTYDAITHTTLPVNTVIKALPTNCQLAATTLTCLHEPIAPSQQAQTQLLIDTSNSIDSRVRSEITLDTHVDHNLVNNVAVLNLPDTALAGNGLVTVSTNPASNNSDSFSGSVISINAAVSNETQANETQTVLAQTNETQTDAPLTSTVQSNPFESAFSRIGATSTSTILMLLLLTAYRLVFTINRVKRNRL